MKLLSDVNFLLALVAECNAHHPTARRWWEGLPGTEIVHICRPVQTALLRLLCTEAAMGEDAVTLPVAWSIYANLLASGRFAFVLEPRGVDPLWEEFCRPFKRAPKVVMDAYLAAFAVAGGFQIITYDEAFSQFHDVSFTIPAPSALGQAPVEL